MVAEGIKIRQAIEAAEMIRQQISGGTDHPDLDEWARLFPTVAAILKINDGENIRIQLNLETPYDGDITVTLTQEQYEEITQLIEQGNTITAWEQIQEIMSTSETTQSLALVQAPELMATIQTELATLLYHDGDVLDSEGNIIRNNGALQSILDTASSLGVYGEFWSPTPDITHEITMADGTTLHLTEAQIAAFANTRAEIEQLQENGTDTEAAISRAMDLLNHNIFFNDPMEGIALSDQLQDQLATIAIEIDQPTTMAMIIGTDFYGPLYDDLAAQIPTDESSWPALNEDNTYSFTIDLASMGVDAEGFGAELGSTSITVNLTAEQLETLQSWDRGQPFPLDLIESFRTELDTWREDDLTRGTWLMTEALEQRDDMFGIESQNLGAATTLMTGEETEIGESLGMSALELYNIFMVQRANDIIEQQAAAEVAAQIYNGTGMTI